MPLPARHRRSRLGRAAAATTPRWPPAWPPSAPATASTASRPLRYDSGSLPVYAIGSRHVLKLFPPHEGGHAAIEARALAAVHGALPIPTPRLLAADTLDGWHCLLMTPAARRAGWSMPGRELAARRARPPGRSNWARPSRRCMRSTPRALADFDAALGRVPARAARQRRRAPARTPASTLTGSSACPTSCTRWMPPIDARRALLHTEVMREHLLVDARRQRLAPERPVRLRAGDARRAGVRLRLGRPVRRLRRRPLPAPRAAGLRLPAATSSTPRCNAA